MTLVRPASRASAPFVIDHPELVLFGSCQEPGLVPDLTSSRGQIFKNQKPFFLVRSMAPLRI